jgi:Fe-S-cluster containining protein
LNQVDRSLEATTQRMEGRRAELIAVLPAELKDREDALPARIRADNAGAQSKLGRIYALVDEFSAYRAPYVACQQGCSDCCRMNVQISNLEAARIAGATGRRARDLARSVQHDNGKFAGQACPFLEGDSCSIYAHRPYVCRNHASFDVDPYWCEPERMQTVKLPMLELSGARQAVIEVLKQTKRPMFADIRDFFPRQATA